MALHRTTPTSLPRRHSSALATAGRLSIAVALLAGWLGTGTPAGAQPSDGLDGDSFTSDGYGWSVVFDKDLWSAEEVAERGSEGVQLSAESNEVFVNLVVYDDGITEAGDCLDDLDQAFTSSEDWEDIAVARGLDAPETAPDAAGELYTGALVLDDGSIDLVLYLECREVEGATLTVAVTAIEESYADNLPDIEALLAGVDTGGGASSDDPEPDEPDTGDDGPSNTDPVNRDDDPTPASDDPTPEEDEPTAEPEEDEPTAEPEEEPTPDAADPTPRNDPPVELHAAEDQLGQDVDGTLDDGSYRSDLGYGLSWDPDAFEGETGDDPGTGVVLESPDTGATFEVAAFEDPSIDDCIAAEVARIVDSPDYVSAAGSNGTRPPTSSDDAAGRVLRATEDTTQQARKMIYVECRPLADEEEAGDPVFLVVRAISDDEDFRASRALFETLLAAITVGDEPAPEPTREPTEEPEEEPTPRPRRTPTPEPEDEPENLGETDLADGVFVGSQFPFRVEWSTAYWQVEELDEGIQEGISLVTEAGAFGRIVSADTPANYGADQCLLDNVAQWAELSSDFAEFEPPAGQEIVWPDGALTAYGIGTLTLDDGTEVPLVSAAGCVELGDGEDYLVMSIQTFEPVYAENAAAFGEVLATIEIGESGGGQQGTLAPIRRWAGSIAGDAIRPEQTAVIPRA